VAFAALAMGGWAWLANHRHGLEAAAGPALAQGTMSGGITLGPKRALESMSARFGAPAAYLVPPAITAAAVLSALAAHRLIGTPAIAATIAVPWSVSTLYAILYSAALARLKARTP
jgi:hypothetical protein